MRIKMLIIGAGDLGAQVKHWAELNATGVSYDIVGFVDDTKNKDSLFEGLPILGCISDMESLYEAKLFEEAFIAIGYNHFNVREYLYQKLKASNIPLATIIAPQTYIDSTSNIGRGCLIHPGCIISMNAVIEDNVILMNKVVIEHDAIIKKHSFVAPGATCAGFVSIGEKCFIGANAVIKEKLNICDETRVGALTFIRKHITESGTYVLDSVTQKI